jgi:hypothetical protein
MSSYRVGSDGSNIVLSIKVSTTGIAVTRAQFINGAATDLPGCPCDAGGNIIDCMVGPNTKLKGKNLGIGTSVNLQPVDPALWPTMYASLMVTYILSGGPDGTKEFPYTDAEKSKDDTGQFIKVDKEIKLTA